VDVSVSVEFSVIDIAEGVWVDVVDIFAVRETILAANRGRRKIT